MAETPAPAGEEPPVEKMRYGLRKTDYDGSLWTRLTRLIFYAPMSAAEFIVGIAPFLWGARLLVSGAYSSSPSWDVFSHYTNERVVGFTMLVTGLVQMLAAVSPAGSYYHRVHYWFAVWHLVAWSATGVLFAFANPGGVLWIDAVAVVVPQFWVVMRIGHVPRPKSGVHGEGDSPDGG